MKYLNFFVTNTFDLIFSFGYILLYEEKFIRKKILIVVFCLPCLILTTGSLEIIIFVNFIKYHAHFNSELIHHVPNRPMTSSNRMYYYAWHNNWYSRKIGNVAVNELIIIFYFRLYVRRFLWVSYIISKLGVLYFIAELFICSRRQLVVYGCVSGVTGVRKISF